MENLNHLLSQRKKELEDLMQQIDKELKGDFYQAVAGYRI